MMYKSIKKKYYGLLLVVLSIILFAPYSKVNAEVLSTDVNSIGSTIHTFTQGSYNYMMNVTGNKFANKEGNILLTFTYYTDNGSQNSINNSFINAVNIHSGSWRYPCNIGTLGAYKDSTVAFETYSVVCPVEMSSSGLTAIEFEKNYNDTGWIRVGGVISYYSTDFDTSSIVSAISSNTTTLYNLLADINGQEITRHNITTGQLDSIATLISNLNTTIMNYFSAASNDIQSAINSQGQQQHSDSVAEQEAINDNTDAINDLNDTISDSDVSDNGADHFFSNFQDNDHGLSSIITAPLSFIRNLANATCSPISLTIPFVNQTFNFPCMSTIYSQNFGNLFTLYQTITYGIVAYYVCVRIYTLVKGFKNPDDDRIEMMEL